MGLKLKRTVPGPTFPCDSKPSGMFAVFSNGFQGWACFYFSFSFPFTPEIPQCLTGFSPLIQLLLASDMM